MADNILERIQAGLSDRYAIEKELGRGGMAVVYLGHDLKHDRQVAIKVLFPELAASIGADRFEREIKLAAKLNHPHILGLYDSGETNGLLFFVMPFVKGESLRDRIDREGPLPIEDAIQIILEVTDALGFAHSLGIVHRDIKPENILLSNGHALVADFGIAKAASEGGGAKLTQTGMAVGTPVYMAPEQAVGEQVGPTADIYSLGCMLYEMLAGEPPFLGKTAQSIMARHAMETVPSIRIVRTTVPEDVEDAIFAAMAKIPADRPQTAAQFAEFFGIAPGTTATRRTAIRHTATRRIPTHPGIAVPAATNRRRWLVIGAGAAVLAAGAVAAWQIFGGGPAAATGAGESRLDPHQIAVLYFENQSGDSTLGYVADGFTEGLIVALASVSGLQVVSKAGVEPYRGSTVPLDSIGRALQTGALVTGAIERRQDRLQVELQLRDGNSGGTISRSSLSVHRDSVLAARDSLTDAATRLIRESLREEIRVQRQRASTGSLAAWSAYQRGEAARKRWDAASKARDTAAAPVAFALADSAFAEAEAGDGKWVDPIVARGWLAYTKSREVSADPVALRRWIEVGMGHADRAMGIDPTSADVLELRGTLRYFKWLMGAEPDPKALAALLVDSEADLEASTKANPNQAGAWATLSHLYYNTKGPIEVNRAAQEAYRADAFLSNADVILNRLFLSSYDLQAFEPNAVRWCAEIGRRFPASYQAPRCQLYLLSTNVREPDVPRAWRLADSVAALAPTRIQAYQRLNANMLAAAVIAKAGAADSARSVVRRSLGDAEVDKVRELHWFGAFVMAILKDKQGAIDLLKVYLNANERRRASFANDPGWWFRSIQEEPEFKALVDRS